VRLSEHIQKRFVRSHAGVIDIHTKVHT